MIKDVFSEEQYKYIVKEYKRLLRSTKRKGIEDVITALDKEGFFYAKCYSHDHFKGGTANHSLWVTKFGLETLKNLHQNNPDSLKLRADSVILVCLLHDVCDTEGFAYAPAHNKYGSTHGQRSKAILEVFKRSDDSSKCIFTDIELCAIARHMHYGIRHKGPYSYRQAKDLKTLIHYLLHNSDGRAVEYYKNIPFGTKSRGVIKPQFHDSSFSVPLDSNAKRSISICKNDKGVFFISGIGECAEVVVFLTRFPDYRNSYVIVKSVSDGLWWSFRIKTADASIEPISNTGYSTMEESKESMKSGKWLIRVSHSGCFQKILFR